MDEERYYHRVHSKWQSHAGMYIYYHCFIFHIYELVSVDILGYMEQKYF